MMRGGLLVLLLVLSVAFCHLDEALHVKRANFNFQQQEQPTTPTKWCGHDEAQAEAMATLHTADVQYQPTRRDSEQTVFQPIRITFYTQTIDSDPDSLTCYNQGNTLSNGIVCDATNTLTSTKISELKTLISEVQTKASNLLSVKPVTGNIVMGNPNGKCGSVTIPNTLKTTGASNTDIVVLVTARPATGTVLGTGAFCVVDGQARPIAGVVNLNTNNIFSTTTSRNRKLGVILHELFHVMGFTGDRFSQFKNAAGSTYSAVTTETRTFKSQTVSVSYINSPKVLAEAKAHFGCSGTIKGVDLEEFGGSGTAGSHWDMSQMNYDIMVGATYWQEPHEPADKPIVSRLTLALFEDSGWYKANYAAADSMQWLKGYGCSAFDRCENWKTVANNGGISGYFCDNVYNGNNQYHCSYNHLYKGYCALFTGQSLTGYYQHFTDATAGGENPYMNYCPFVYNYGNGDCRSSNNAPSDYTFNGELYTTSSRCFQSNLRRNTLTPRGSALLNGCYDTRCNGNTLFVRVGSGATYAWVQCPTAGGLLSVANYTGQIRCPRSDIICGTPYAPPSLDNPPGPAPVPQSSTNGTTNGNGTVANAAPLTEPTFYQVATIVVFTVVSLLLGFLG